MSQFVKGIQSLFSGPDTGAADAAAAAQRNAEKIALDRQRQTEQQVESDQNVQAGLTGKAPRGRRLLLAATGETGVSNTLG